MQKITIIGNLGNKPEDRHTQSGIKIVSFSVAVRVSKEKSQWYDVSIWEENIPHFSKMLSYLDKGSKICVVGDLSIPNIYQSKDGSTKVKLRIYPDSLNFVGGSASKSETLTMSEDLPF